MKIYLFDGSFEGILTCIYEAYYRKDKPKRILFNSNIQQSFSDEYSNIETNINTADKVYNGVINKISTEAVENAFYAYLSEDSDVGTYIYEYFKLGFKVGSCIDNYLTVDCVYKIHELRRKVSLEAHRMSGLLRFIELRGMVYYGRIEPDNNILLLLAPHFKDRFYDQKWVIHDVKRSIAAIYNNGEWFLIDLNVESLPPISEKEIFFQEIWKEYYKNISIKERLNPRLQKSYMPVRYWKNLIEKKL